MSTTPTTLNYTEAYNASGCKYLLSLTCDQFKNAFCSGVWKTGEGETIARDVRTYHREVKKFCRLVLTSMPGAKQATSYKFAKNCSDGRIYAEQFCIQRLSKPLRDLLTPTSMVDYDMVNCHPVLLMQLAKKHELPCHHLEEYVTDRAAVLAKTGATKQKILMMMNSDYNRPTKEPWLMGFISELKILKEKIYEMDDYRRPTTNQKNPISSCINKTLCSIENDILQKAITKFASPETNYCVPMFDGFMTDKDIDVAELNTIAEGVTWIRKEWTPLKVPDDFDEEEAEGYASCKARFEEAAFIVEHPLMWSMNNMFIPEADFKTRSRVFQFTALDPETCREKKFDIFEKWIRDDTHRSFTSVVSEPLHPNESDPTPSEVYNEAKPFAFDYIQAEKRNTGALQTLQTILEHLTTEPEEADFVLKFIADIFQNPRSNPQVIIVFKGHVGGVGKDTVNKLIHALLGSSYVGSVGDMNLLFGTYNSVLDGKLLLQCNECESKQGHSLWNQIKDQSTADQNCIREKYLPNKWQSNYTRLIVSSNNQNPIPPNRRVMMCQTRVDKIIDKDWFTEFYEALGQKDFLNAIGSDLLDLDLTSFDVKKPPQTAVHTNRTGINIKPIHMFLQKVCEGCFSSDTFPVCEGVIGCKYKWFMNEFHMFHSQKTGNHEQLSVLKKDAHNWLDGEYVKSINRRAKPTVDGEQIRCMTINTEMMLASLKNGKRFTAPDDDE
jgi:hypothetical protein